MRSYPPSEVGSVVDQDSLRSGDRCSVFGDRENKCFAPRQPLSTMRLGSGKSSLEAKREVIHTKLN